MSSSAPFVIGQRVQCGNDMATVRYVGTLEGTGDAQQVWVGVAWDKKGRGKHDGTYKGTRYFQCVAQCGSFVKPAKLDAGVDFLAAMREKYHATINTDDMYVMSVSEARVPVEFVGKERVEAAHRDFSTIHSATLRGARIATGGAPGAIADAGAGHVRELDLTRNLLADWPSMPELRNLRLNHNLLAPVPSPLPELMTRAFSQLRVLVVVEMGITWDELCRLEPALPHVEELHAAGNALRSLGSGPVQGWAHVRVMSLDNNELTWEGVQQLATLPRLERLQVNENRITHVRHRAGDFAQLTSLSASRNPLSEWAHIAALDDFPALCELRLSGIELANDLGPHVFRSRLIARMPRLACYGGGVVHADERKEAELTFLKLAFHSAHDEDERGSPEFAAEFPHFAELLAKYGDPTPKNAAGSSKRRTLASGVAEVTLVSNVASSAGVGPKKQKVPLTMSVGKLKLVCKRTFKLAPARQTLFYKSASMMLPEEMTDDLKTLAYYNVQEGGTVVMEERNERREQERRDAEAAREQERLESTARMDRAVRHQHRQVAQETAAVQATQQ